MISISVAQITDIPLIIDLAQKIWLKTYLPILGANQLNYMLGLYYTNISLSEQMVINKHKFLICQNDNLPIAFASYSLIDQNKYKLHKLYLLPNQQNKGIGSQLLNHIVANIKSNNAISLSLNVNRYNNNAIAFYLKYGFTIQAEENIDIGNGYFMNDYVMNLELQKFGNA